MSQLKNLQSQIARLQAAQLNMPSSNLSKGVPGNPKRASLQRKKTKEKMEEEDESPVTPDSTTEPPKPVHDFHEGDDVFYLNAEGQNILGTVARVTPNSCLVSFGDGTEEWAVFKRLKKLGCSFNEPPAVKQSETAMRSIDSEPQNSSKTEKMQVTCTVCKCSKEVSRRKAGSYRGDYKCTKCENKNGAPAGNQKISGSISVHQVKADTAMLGKQNIRRNSLTAAPVKLGSQGKVYVNGEVRRSVPPGIQPGPSKGLFPKAVPISHKGFNSKRGPPDVTILDYFQPKPALESTTPPYRPLKPTVDKMYSPCLVSNECFHCRGVTNFVDRVDCKMCDRHCHLFCLQLQPCPLNGDRFWDLMCSACGTQNGSEKEARNKVFSVRRNISSWSDVVHLIISCLIAKNGGQHFDLDSQILPFLEKNIDRLHLPRLYKQASREDRKNNILTALTSSKLRFSKHTGSDLKRTNSSLWSLASPITSPVRDASVPMKGIANQIMSSKLLNPGGVKRSRPESLTISPTSSNLNISKTPSEASLTTITSVPGKSKSPARASPPSYANTPQVMLSAAKTVLSVNRTSTANSPSHAASKLFQSSPKRGLSITPIPTPNQSVSGSYKGCTSDSVSISVAGSPKVLSKEAIMRAPVNTNIVLSPTKGSAPNFASTVFLTSTPSSPSSKNDYLSVEKVPNQSMSSSSIKFKTENIQTDQVNHTARDDLRGNGNVMRGNLKVRIPLKPPAATGQDADKISSTKTTSSMTFPILQNLPEVPRHGIRSTKRASPEESDDEASSEDSLSASSFKKIKLTAGNHCTSPIKANPLKTLVKLEASPMRLGMGGSRPRLVRSAVLKTKVTQSQKAANALKEKASGRGRGRLTLNKRSSNGSAEPCSESSVTESGRDLKMVNGYGNKKGVNGTGIGNNAASISRRSRRIGKLSGAGKRLLAAAEELDPETQDLRNFNENLLNQVMVGDIRVQCLPRPLCVNNSENALRLASYFTEDPQDDFSDSESVLSVGGKSRDNSETESSNGNTYVRKNRFGKTVDDTDAYEVAGSRLNAQGKLEYLLVWKEPATEGELDFDDEINRIFFGNSYPVSVKTEPGIIKSEPMETVIIAESIIDCEAKMETDFPAPEVQTNVTSPSKTAAQSFASNYKVIGVDGMSAPEKVAPVILRSNSLSSSSTRNSLRTGVIDLSDSS